MTAGASSYGTSSCRRQTALYRNDTIELRNLFAAYNSLSSFANSSDEIRVTGFIDLRLCVGLECWSLHWMEVDAIHPEGKVKVKAKPVSCGRFISWIKQFTAVLRLTG